MIRRDSSPWRVARCPASNRRNHRHPFSPPLDRKGGVHDSRRQQYTSWRPRILRVPPFHLWRPPFDVWGLMTYKLCARISNAVMPHASCTLRSRYKTRLLGLLRGYAVDGQGWTTSLVGDFSRSCMLLARGSLSWKLTRKNRELTGKLLT